MDPQTALIVAVTAAVLGQVLGASLTVVGGLVNDYLSSRREERREKRELQARRDQWEREDRARKDQEDRQAAVQRAQERIAAYKRFLDATASPGSWGRFPTSMEYLAALDSAYLDVLFNCSDHVRSPAEQLHMVSRKLAVGESSEEEEEELSILLNSVRGSFYYGVRLELKEIPYESRVLPVLPD